MAYYYYAHPPAAPAAPAAPQYPQYTQYPQYPQYPQYSRDTESWRGARSIYDFNAIDIDGREVSLERYRGHICLILNVACKWSLTNRDFTQLQALYDEFAVSRGLRILAFPCNQFMNQEPGTNADIKQFVRQKFGISFDMFSKIEVNGPNALPLWKWLKMRTGIDYIRWNFTKVLIDQYGAPIKVYSPDITPSQIRMDLIQRYF